MKSPDWTQFKRIIYINSTVEEIYRKWASQEGMETWFLKKAESFSKDGSKRDVNELAQTGDTYLWEWHNWEGQHRGEVISANGKDEIVMTFDNSRLTIKVFEGRGKVCCHLTQDQIPTDDNSKFGIYHGCSCGWTFWLANLKALLEHGITLNDTEPGLVDEHRDFDVVNI